MTQAAVFNPDAALLRLDEESTELLYDTIETHQKETGAGITAPDLAEKLLGNKRFAVAVTYMVAACLAGRVEAQKGPGGGFLVTGMERKTQSRGQKSGQSITVEPDFIEKVKESVAWALSKNKSVATNALAMLVSSRHEIEASPAQVRAAMAHLVNDYEEKRPLGFVKRNKLVIENPLAG